jgi:hypothetical protein
MLRCVVWTDQTIPYARMKTRSDVMIRFGGVVAQILQRRPATDYTAAGNGALFCLCLHHTGSK